MIPNLESLLQQQREKSMSRNREMDWIDYHTWDEMNAWLNTLVDGSPNGLITAIEMGKSLEGRALMVYKISTGGSSENKPAFFIDSTIHAREHITTAVITYMINELVANQTKYEDILSSVDFYFAPFLNPDGFVYSHEVDRMWRKTRSNWGNHSEACMGVDANRNFGFHWGEAGGSSDNPCSGSYRGPEPFSEPEARALRDFILGQKETGNVSWAGYVTLHSYSQLWISPWGYTRVPPEGHQEVVRVANLAVAELKSYFNTTYVTGSSGAVLCMGKIMYILK